MRYFLYILNSIHLITLFTLHIMAFVSRKFSVSHFRKSKQRGLYCCSLLSKQPWHTFPADKQTPVSWTQ